MSLHSHADQDHEGKNQPSFRNADQEENRSFWRSKAAMVMLVSAAIAGFFLITEHWAHLYGVLPFLFILACPLMHIFMHRGHGGHHRHDGRQSGDPQPGSTPDKGARP